MRSDVFGYVRVRSDEKKIDEFFRSKIGPAGKGWRRAGGERGVGIGKNGRWPGVFGLSGEG